MVTYTCNLRTPKAEMRGSSRQGKVSPGYIEIPCLKGRLESKKYSATNPVT